MEEHLKNEHLLSEEWNKLCSYQSGVTSSPVARDKANASKNFYSDESLLPCEQICNNYCANLCDCIC